MTEENAVQSDRRLVIEITDVPLKENVRGLSASVTLRDALVFLTALRDWKQGSQMEVIDV